MSDPFGGWNPGGAGTAAKGPSSSDPFGGWQGAVGAGAGAPRAGASPFAGAAAKGRAPLANPHAGFGGFFNDLGNFVSPLNTPKLVANIAGAVWNTGHNAADMAAGAVTGDVPQHLRSQPGENFLNYAARVAPVAGGILKGAQQTGVDVAGAVQGLAGIGQGGRGLLGRGFQHEAAQRWSQNPFAAALGDVGTVALAAGPLTGGLSAAGDALAPSADAAAAGAEPGLLSRGLTSAAETTAQGGELANRAMTAPFLPIKGALLGGTLPVAGDVPGLVPILADRATSLPRLGPKIADWQAQAEARDYLVHGPAQRAAVERAQLTQNAAEANRALAGAPEPGLLARILNRGGPTPDPAMSQALQLRTVLGGPEGARAILGPALDHPEVLAAAGERFMSNGAPITPEAARLAAGMGTPEQEAALTQAQAIRSGPIEQRAAEMLAGRGMLGPPMSPEQLGNQPLSYGINAATTVPEQAAQAAQARATALRAMAPNAPANLPPLTDAQAEAVARSVGIPVDAVRQAEALRQGGTTAEMTAADTQAATLRATADQARAEAEANPANAPARFRPSLGVARTVQQGLNDATAADKVTPGAGDIIRQGAQSVPTTLAALNDAGIDPQHLIGSLDDLAKNYGDRATRADAQLPRVRKLASENVKTAGIVPADLPTAIRPELQRITQVVANESAGPFQERFGTSAGAVASDAADGRQMASAVKAAGYTPWNPKVWTETVPADQVIAETPVIPTPLYRAFSDYWSPKPPTGANAALGTAWDTMIRGGKNLTVGLNPAYHAAVILGNTLKAATLGGVGLLELGRGMADAVRMLREDPANELAVGAGRGNLSAEQADMLTGRSQYGQGQGITSRLAGPGWKFSGYIQQVQKLGLTLAKIDESSSPAEMAAAVKNASLVMGDFGNLSPFEQNVVRRIIPGYAFYKHITTLALSLPVVAPERIAWLNYLSNAAGPQGNVPYFLNPLGMFGGLPSLALPIRAGAELAGFKVSPQPSRERMLTSPPRVDANGKPVAPSPLVHGGAALPETAYILAQLFPEGRLVNAATRPNVHRYDTGEPRLAKGGTGPGGSTPYPGGRLGAIMFALGLASPPATPAAPTPGALAYNKAQASAARKYQARLGAYNRGKK